MYSAHRPRSAAVAYAPTVACRLQRDAGVKSARTSNARPSISDPLARRVVEGPQRNARGHALGRDLDLVVARRDPLIAHGFSAIRDVAEPERRADRVPERPRGDAAGQ